MTIERFIDLNKPDTSLLKYSAGRVETDGGTFFVACEQAGAAQTFSVGQPVYDEEGALMGFLKIGLYEHLDYGTGSPFRIPCERWEIGLPTKHCANGKKVVTYWQHWTSKEEEEEAPWPLKPAT